MTINLANLKEQVIDMDKFDLNWRFTEERYDILPPQHLEQIKPLSEKAANQLNALIRAIELHAHQPFK